MIKYQHMSIFFFKFCPSFSIEILSEKKEVYIYIYNCMQIKSNLSYHSSIGSSLSQLIVSGSGALNLEHCVTVGHRLSWSTTCTSGRDSCNPQSCSNCQLGQCQSRGGSASPIHCVVGQLLMVKMDLVLGMWSV